jgi:hypothetical protein
MQKKNQPICQFQYPKPPINIQKYYYLQMNKIICQTMMKLIFKFKKLIDMGLSENISFEQFLLDLKIDEKTYLFGLCHITKNQFFF